MLLENLRAMFRLIRTYRRKCPYWQALVVALITGRDFYDPEKLIPAGRSKVRKTFTKSTAASL